jgi:MFS transporter, FHS family, L-fucose permease
MASKKTIVSALPVLLGFFVMGFVDVVGISTSYVKNDFQLSDTLSNLLPAMVFLWFAVFSVPTGILMNKLGRKNTVLSSMVITILALMVPLVAYNFVMVLIAFALLGIGNTIFRYR